MPYIITTTYPPEHGLWLTQRVVATLGEAKHILRTAIRDAEWPDDIGGHNARQSARGQVDDLMASGGRAIRLPGGTRIEGRGAPAMSAPVRKQITAACPCGGSGQIHHNASGDDSRIDALSYWTPCRDPECLARRDAAFMGVSEADVAAYMTTKGRTG